MGEISEEHREILRDVIDGIDPNIIWEPVAAEQAGEKGWNLKLRKNDRDGELWISRQEVASAELSNRESRLSFERKLQAAIDAISF